VLAGGERKLMCYKHIFVKLKLYSLKAGINTESKQIKNLI